MVERLLAALRALAAPGPDHPDDIAPEYADAWFLARQCPGLELTSGQVRLLDALDAALDACRNLEPGAAEWSEARLLARRALEMLDGTHRPPQPPA